MSLRFYRILIFQNRIYSFIIALFTKFSNNRMCIMTFMRFTKLRRKVFPLLWDSHSSNFEWIFCFTIPIFLPILVKNIFLHRKHISLYLRKDKKLIHTFANMFSFRIHKHEKILLNVFHQQSEELWITCCLTCC